MPRKRLVIVRIGFLIGLAMTVAWSLEPLFGPWVAVEATVYGRDRDVYISIEEDEPNEYFAVLDLCYEHDGGVFLDRHFLSHDGPTGWKLQDLVGMVPWTSKKSNIQGTLLGGTPLEISKSPRSNRPSWEGPLDFSKSPRSNRGLPCSGGVGVTK